VTSDVIEILGLPLQDELVLSETTAAPCLKDKTREVTRFSPSRPTLGFEETFMKVPRVGLTCVFAVTFSQYGQDLLRWKQTLHVIRVGLWITLANDRQQLTEVVIVYLL
jgi:hypothetical protein